MEIPHSRARIFLPVFVAASLASLVYVFSRPAVYVSAARLQVELLAGERQSEEGNTPPNLLIAAQALTSNAVLDRVVERVKGANLAGNNLVGSVDALRGMLTATPVAGTNVIELRAEGSSRQVLPRIVSAWIDAYRESQTAMFDKTSAAALEEARGSVEQLKQEVAAKRQELEQFRKKYDIVSIERDENQATAQLKGLNTALNEARSREVNAEGRVNAMRENLASGKRTQGSTDRAIVVELEKRASDLRDKMKDLEQEFTSLYLAVDPKYKAMLVNLARLEQQIKKEEQASVSHAMQSAEEELASARQTAMRVQQELAARKREAQDFATRFSEHTALANELQSIEGTYDSEKQRLALLEKDNKGAGPKLTELSAPSVPALPDRPDYWRDTLIGIGGSCALGLLTVWFVEFFKRSGVPRAEPVAQPIIHISYPPAVAFDPGVAVLGATATSLLGATAARLPDTITQFPRELSGPEVRALWSAATPDARVVIAGLLGGLSLDDIGALRYENIDMDANCARIPGPSGRSCKLRDPLRAVLTQRRAEKGGAAPLVDERGQPLSEADLEGLIACAACDAGLANSAEVNAEALRHTYFAYLIRQGARLAEIGEFIGRIPPAAFREYGRLSPAGPGMPLEEIDPVFPALRAPLA
jgi:uncharacterized protein involved in exopolysaccharide biosynthesis